MRHENRNLLLPLALIALILLAAPWWGDRLTAWAGDPVVHNTAVQEDPAPALSGGWMTIANGDDVRVLVQDGEFIWAGTYAGGALRWDPATGVYTQYLRPQHGIAGNQVRDIAMDAAGNRWFATNLGLSRQAPDGTWTTFTLESTYQRGDQVSRILADAPAGAAEVTMDFRNPTYADQGLQGGLLMLGDDPTLYYYEGARQGSGNTTIVRITPELKQPVTNGTGVHKVRLGLPSNDVTAVAVAPGGEVWVGTQQMVHHTSQYDGRGFYGGGVARLAPDGTWTSWGAAQGLSSNNVTDIAIEPGNGNVWVTTMVYLTWRPPDPQDPTDRGSWITEGGGVSRWDGNRWTIYQRQPENPSSYPSHNSVLSVAIDGAGRKWFATWGGGLNVLEGTSRWNKFTVCGYSYVRTVAVDPSGQVWSAVASNSVGTGRGVGALDHNDTISNTDDDVWTCYTTEDSGLAGDTVAAILADSSGALWFGISDPKGNGRGISRLDLASGQWTTYTIAPTGLRSNQITAIATAPDGPTWFGSGDLKETGRGRGLSIWHPDGTWTHVDSKFRGRGAQVTTVTADTPAGSTQVPVGFTSRSEATTALPTGYVMFGDDPTIYEYVTFYSSSRTIRIRPGLVQPAPAGTPVYAVTLGIGSDSISDIAFDCEGRAWVGTRQDTWDAYLGNYVDGGLCVLETTGWHCYTAENSSLPNNNVSAVAVEPPSCGCKVWVGTGSLRDFSGFGLCSFNPATGQWQCYSYSRLPSNNITDISVDPSTCAVWIATAPFWVAGNRVGGGVARFDGSTWTKWDNTNGLASTDNDFRSVAAVPDGSGRAWAGTWTYDGACLSCDWPRVTATVNLFNGSAWQHWDFPFDGWISSLAIDGQGRVWAGTSRWREEADVGEAGIHIFDGANWTLINPANSRLHTRNVQVLSTDQGGNVWVGTTQEGAIRYSPPPPAPTNLTCTALSESEIRLEWTDNSADETGFWIEQSLNGETGWREIGVVPANTTVYTDSNLAPATTYFYRVRAYRSLDRASSAYSNVTQCTTFAPPTDTPTVTPTPTSTATPTSTPTPTLTPTASPTPTSTSTHTPTASPTPTPTPTETFTPSPTSSPTDTVIPVETPTVTPTDTGTPVATSTPSPTVSPTATPSSTQMPGVTATPSRTVTPRVTATGTATASPSPNPASPTPTQTPGRRPYRLFLAYVRSGLHTSRRPYRLFLAYVRSGLTTRPSTPTPTWTPSPTFTPSPSPVNTATATWTTTATQTPTPSPTTTLPASPSPTLTLTPTLTTTQPLTHTPTPSRTVTPSVTTTETPVPTPTSTPSVTATETPVPTHTSTPSLTPTETSTPTATPTATISPSPSSTATITLTPTLTETPTVTATATPTATPSPTATVTQTPTPSPSSTPTRAPIGTWSIEYVGEHTLHDVFFTDATHGWAVGDRGTILQYNGTAWISQTGSITQSLNAVFMVSSTEGWAVGEGGTLLRYNRGRWTPWTLDYIPEESLADIHMVSANEGWFVTRESKIYRYADGHWTLDPNSPDNSFGLNALSLAPDGASGWAVGTNGVQVRFRGYWEPIRNADRDLHDVHVIAEDLGWAVGHSSLRYLSRQNCGMLGPICWKDYQGSLPSGLTFYGVHMLSQMDAWAVGAQGAIYHWDGERWTSVVEPHPFRKDLHAVFMVSPTEGWAVGQDGAIAHYTVPPPPPTNTATPGPSPTPTASRTLTPTTTPTPTTSPTATGTSPATVTPTFTVTPTATPSPGGTSQPRGVWSLARSDGADLLGLHFLDSTHGWVVGREGTILRYNNGTWEAQDSPTENDLHAVHMLSLTAGWAVGDGSIVLRYAQGRWSLYEDDPIPADDYVAITMTTDGQGWIIGRGGKVLKYSNGRWKQDLTAPDGVTGLNSVFTTEDGSRGWAVGDSGILLERIGESAWQELGRIVFQNHYAGDIVPDPANAESPWAGWIVGEHVASNISGMLRYPGNECGARFAPCWVTYTEPPHADLYGVDLISPDHGWAVGEAGTIAYWDGASWTILASTPTISTLRAVQMLSPTEGWAVGDGGTILRYAPADLKGKFQGPWGRRSGGLRTR